MQQQKAIQVFDSDGLVVIPTQESSRPVRVGRWFVIVFFGLLILGTPILDMVAPAPEITLLGAERVRDALLRREATLWDGTLFRLWEHDLRLRSRVRRWSTDQFGWMLYRVFGHVQGGVVSGDEGWLFLRSRIEIPENLKTDFLALRAGASIAGLDRRLASYGLRSVFVPIPRKAALLSDHLPSHLEPRADVDRSIIADLRHRGLSTIDLWQAYSEELEEPPYHLLGSHWTDEAQLVAAKAVGEELGWAISEAERSTTVAPTIRGKYDGDVDLLKFCGLEGRPQLPKAAARESLTVWDHAEKWAPALEPVRLVVIGTSFTGGRQFAGLISHIIGGPVFKMADSGEFPGSMLARFIADRKWVGRTEEVVIEVPCHHLIKDPVARLVAPLFALPPANPLLKYFSIAPEMYSECIGNDGPGSTVRGNALVKSGRLAHTGDGVLGIRVNGHVNQKVLLHLAPVGGEPVKIVWKPGTHHVVLPLISVTESAGAIWFAMTPTSDDPLNETVTIKSIDIVSEVRPQPRVILAAGKPTQTDDSWETWIDVPEDELSPTALLELELDAKGKFARDLAVEVHPSGKNEPLTAEWAELKRDALVVVSLARFAGQTIDRVKISGSGPPPRKLLKRAALQPGK